jgi:signal transduction histidine kinase
MIQNAIEEVRKMQTDLRPPILDDLGILATISWFCREYQQIYSTIRVEKEIEIGEADVPPSLKTVIYRLMQEALNNVAKHSQAKQVRLALLLEQGWLKLQIEDDGLGFDLQDVSSEDRPLRGLGLTSMRERTELSGGSFSLLSRKGKGTLIQASWKL